MRSFEYKPPNRGVDAALLVLRLGAGVSLFFLFGLQKIHDASGYAHTGQWSFADFNRKVGLPMPVLAAFLQTFNETIAALLLAAGLFGRIPAGCLTAGFAVATWCSLKVGEPAWMMAGCFCLMFLTLLLAGPGRFSLDHALWLRKAGRLSADQSSKMTVPGA